MNVKRKYLYEQTGDFGFFVLTYHLFFLFDQNHLTVELLNFGIQNLGFKNHNFGF